MYGPAILNVMRKVVLVVLGLAAVSCDPGMEIRQLDQVARSADSVLIVQVPKSRNLIGEGFYAPEGVEATNISTASLSITRVELMSGEKTYAWKQVGPGKYPINLEPGASAKLPIWFDLKPSYLSAVFKKPVELRVSYETGGQKNYVSAFFVGKE